MSCAPALAIVGGQQINGSGFSSELSGQVTTTDATVQTVRVADLPASGAGVYFRAVLRGQQDNGQRGFRADFWCDASRNAIGTGGLQTGTIGPTGYTDAAAVPWTTVGVPAGWGLATIVIVGSVINFQFNGAAGQTVRWMYVVERIFLGGAIA